MAMGKPAKLKAKEVSFVRKIFASMEVEGGAKTTKPKVMSYQQLYFDLINNGGMIGLIAKGTNHIVRLFDVIRFAESRDLKITYPEGTLINNAEGYSTMIQPVTIEGEFAWRQ